jgi:hypothetical protein
MGAKIRIIDDSDFGLKYTMKNQFTRNHCNHPIIGEIQKNKKRSNTLYIV